VGAALTKRASLLERHAHSGHELFFVVKGEALFELEDQSTLLVTGGQQSYLPPDTIHHGRADHMAPCLWCWLVFTPDAPNAARNATFTPDELEQLKGLFKNRPRSVRTSNTNMRNTLHRFRLAIAEHSTNPSPLSTILLRSLVCEVIVECARQLDPAESPTRTTYGEAAVDYIKANLFERLTVPDIAEHLGFSVSRTHALFREYTGQSPNYYILSLRLKAAEKMLAETPRSITDIALECGFSSSQYFSRQFKKFHGITPSRFRNARGEVCSPESATP
jgi:AraC-like DNA-binding protein